MSQNHHKKMNKQLSITNILDQQPYLLHPQYRSQQTENQRTTRHWGHSMPPKENLQYEWYYPNIRGIGCHDRFWLNQISSTMELHQCSPGGYLQNYGVQYRLETCTGTLICSGTNKLLVGKQPLEHHPQHTRNQWSTVPARRDGSSSDKPSHALHTTPWRQQSWAWIWCWARLQGKNNKQLRVGK